MIIQQIETYPLFFRLQEPYGDANGYKHYRTCYLFRIRTQSGVDGWGECIDWLPTLEQGFRNRIIPFLIGKKITDRSKLVATIQKWHGRIAAGVSMALTEILAKQAGLHVCDLWGGARRKKIPVYASFQSYSNRHDWIRHSLRQVEKAVSDGFRQIKVKVGGKRFEEDTRHISSLLGMLEGEASVALDANQSYDPATALKWNRLFEEAKTDWLWFEEPIPTNDSAAYSHLRPLLKIPVAGGENLREPRQFLSFLQAESLDIIQPDPMHLGGIDPFRDTLQLARYKGGRVSPHTYDGILSGLYAIFAQSCLPDWSKMEGESIEPVEWDWMENPFHSLLPIEPVQGVVIVPKGIGIGIEWDEKQLEAFRWDGAVYS
jgi:D-galactarolactone cycloisomerase